MLGRFQNYLANEGAKLVVLITWLGINASLFYSTFLYYYGGPQFYYLHEMLGTLRVFRRLVDRSKSFHIACGYMIFLMAVIHCGAHVFNAVNFSNYYNTKYHDVNVAAFANQHPLIVIITSVPGITGISMATILAVITYYASKATRSRNYRRFVKIHHLFIAFYILLLIHACSGVLKFQTNTAEHTPGCFIITGVDENETLVFAEPEPEPANMHFIKLSGDDVVVPEMQPVAEGEPYNALPPSRSYSPCQQPEPKFKSCSTEAWRWLLIPLVLYGAERLLRFFGKAISVTKLVEHPNNVLEIEFFNSALRAKPGQSIWIRCPSIAATESHPFTLTSVPTKDNPYFTIHMSVVGVWTGLIKEHLVASFRTSTEATKGQGEILTVSHERSKCLDESNVPRNEIPVFYADGPYGTPMEDIFKYSVSACVAGGIGITPYAAVLNMIKRGVDGLRNCKLRRLYLVWICRTVDSFEWFIDLINSVQTQLWNQNMPDFLNVYLHVTSRENEDQKSVRDICSKLIRCRLERRRPNFEEFFTELSNRHQRTKVGVFCCGPQSLNTAVRKQCIGVKMKTGVRFIYNKESF